jgi:hypothetical protein
VRLTHLYANLTIISNINEVSVRRFLIFTPGLISIILSILVLLSPSLVLAFSGYGAGTSTNPYRIATCAQLEEINNNLAGYYVLVSNVNCLGTSFTHLADSSSFTGTLNGQDHTIANLSVDADGFFNLTTGATIENLNISSGSVSGSGFVGSFVAGATSTTLTNLHSAMTVTATAGSAGGIAGALYGTSSINGSSFSGMLNGRGYSGGLAGMMPDSGTSISDSFDSGTVNVNAGASYIGGIIGGFINGTISRVYSSATLNLNGGSYEGGLIGDSQSHLSNSFSATTLVGTNSSSGAVTGLSTGGTYTNDYFDEYLNNTANVCGATSCTATAENVGNASPNYFKANDTNGPFSTWNFSSVWSVTSSYPTLKNLQGFVAPSGIPNSGDANADGTLDSYQANVLSVEDNNGVWSTVAVPSSGNCTIDSGASLTISSVAADSGYAPQSNLTTFNAYCPTVGATVPITIIYSKQLNVSNAVLRYYNPTTKSYSTVPNAVFSTVTIGGVTETTVTYTITDGGPLDEDGIANGVIIDPVVVAIHTASVSAPDTGFGLHTSNVDTTVVEYGAISIGLLVMAWVARKYASKK